MQTSQTRKEKSSKPLSREAILRAYGLNSFVCYLGVGTEIFKPLNCAKENCVLSVGACNPAKGIRFYLEISRFN
ncbi:MAG: hypothetical protein ACUVTD_01195 [Nitrososphaerales archaeon]